MDPYKHQGFLRAPTNDLPDAPSTPMTTMDMFLGPPDEAPSQSEESGGPSAKLERPSRKILRFFGRSPTKETSPVKQVTVPESHLASDLPSGTITGSPTEPKHAMSLRDKRTAPALPRSRAIVGRPTIVTADLVHAVPMTASVISPVTPTIPTTPTTPKTPTGPTTPTTPTTPMSAIEDSVSEIGSQGETLGELAGRLERVEGIVEANRDLLVGIDEKLRRLLELVGGERE